MSEPPRVPLIDDPEWLQAPGGEPPAASGSEPPEDPQQWIRDMQQFFTTPDELEFLDAVIEMRIPVTAYERITFVDTWYDAKQGAWLEVKRKWGGSASRDGITMIRGDDPGENAALVFHEGVHALQSDDMAEIDAEFQAHLAEEIWRHRHDLPESIEGARIEKPDGTVSFNERVIGEYVEERYPPGNTRTTPDGTTETVIGYDEETGDTIVLLDDGTTTTRDPIDGDRLPGVQVNEPAEGIPVDLNLVRGR